jgi:hypothetical protein
MNKAPVMPSKPITPKNRGSRPANSGGDGVEGSAVGETGVEGTVAVVTKAVGLGGIITGNGVVVEAAVGVDIGVALANGSGRLVEPPTS